MKNIDKNILERAEVISENLYDVPADKVYIIISRGRNYGHQLFKLTDGKFSRAEEAEWDAVSDAFEEEDFEIDNFDLFEKAGVYVFYFRNKELIDYKFIPVEGEFNIFSDTENSAVVLNKLYGLMPEKAEDVAQLEQNLRIENIFNKDNNNARDTDLSYKGIEVKIFDNIEESQAHVAEDFGVLKPEIERIIKERFIPWLKGKTFADRDDEKIFEGLKLYEITYDHTRNYGEFSFSFESGNDYTEDMLEAVGFDVTVAGTEIRDDQLYCYDI